jgi:hypothetical protein
VYRSSNGVPHINPPASTPAVTKATIGLRGAVKTAAANGRKPATASKYGVGTKYISGITSTAPTTPPR